MRCPHCKQRALGLLAWIVHMNFQPIWRQHRYRTHCRKCGTELDPTAGEKTAGMLIIVGAVVVGFGVHEMMQAPRPPLLPILLGALLLGEIARYPFARYRPVDPAVSTDLPTVRAVEKKPPV